MITTAAQLNAPVRGANDGFTISSTRNSDIAVDRANPLPAALSAPVYLDSKDDFPIFAQDTPSTRKVENWGLEARSLYRLPTTVPIDPNGDLSLEKNEYSYPCANFGSPIRTKNIFEDSQRLYGVDLNTHAKGNHDDIKRRANNLPETIPTQERYRRALTRSANRLYGQHRDFPLKGSVAKKLEQLVPLDVKRKKFNRRSTGFKYALRLYLNNLKNYQPYLYRFCQTAAKELAKGDSRQRPKGICSIAVHQSESNLPNLLLQLSKQEFDKSSCPIFLFVNGDDEKKIQARLDEIQEFKTRVDPKLDVRVVAAKLDTWRYGLKSIPYITALMTVAMQETQDDSDMASLFFDADILRFENDKHLSHYIGAINDGWVRASSYFEDDLELLEKQNYNYYLLHCMSEVSSVLGDRGQKQRFGIDDYELTKDGIHCSGGDTGFSTIANLLCGATSSHVNHEDYDWSTRATSQLAKAHGSHFESDDNFYHAITVPNTHRSGIIHDGGHLVRVANTGRSVLDVWDSHDEIVGNLNPIGPDFKGVNHLRFVEEVVHLYRQILDDVYRNVGSADDAVTEKEIGHVRFSMMQILSLKQALEQVFRDLYPQLLENQFVIALDKNNSDEMVIFLKNKYMEDRKYQITKDGVNMVSEIPTEDNDDYEIGVDYSVSFDYRDQDGNAVSPDRVSGWQAVPKSSN